MNNLVTWTRVDTIEAWIVDVEDKLSIQNVINLENSVKNLVEHTNLLKMSIRDLEDRLVDYEKFLDMVCQDVSAKKSFIQKLMFWR
jgi:ethanolamine utilization cobalamin adenosyltransferase